MTPTEKKLYEVLLSELEPEDSVHIDRLHSLAKKAGVFGSWHSKAIKGLEVRGVLKGCNNFRFLFKPDVITTKGLVGINQGNESDLRSYSHQQVSGNQNKGNKGNHLEKTINTNNIVVSLLKPCITNLFQFNQAVYLTFKVPASIVLFIHHHGFTYKEELKEVGIYQQSVKQVIPKLMDLEIIEILNSTNPLVESFFEKRRGRPGVKATKFFGLHPSFSGASGFYGFCLQIITEVSLKPERIERISNYDRNKEPTGLKRPEKLKFAIPDLKRKIYDPDYGEKLKVCSGYTGYSTEEIDKLVRGGGKIGPE
jgi:hypothetical protein